MAYPLRQLTGNDIPERLREIPDAPQKLFVRGNMPDPSMKFLAVVGSRKASEYGKAVCEELIEGLAGLPIVIVSGLAFGIDAAAHKAALHSGLTTIAVPGSGLDDSVIHPASHVSLAHQIMKQGGALLSEFEPTFAATPWSFPKRNRIMAGLCDATLVVEAGLPSGSLITARLALDYNRDVLAVPGSIFSPQSGGTNDLLRRGATLIEKSSHIADALGFTVETKRQRNFGHLSVNEQLIVALLESPRSRDEVAEGVPLSTAEVNTLLSMLELKNIITEREGLIRLL